MKIAIIGCGFAGLSTALFLSKKENQITLYDKFTDIKAVGAGILIQPSSMVVLKKLELYDELIQHGERVDKLIGINHRKKQVFATYYKDYDEKEFGIGIHRSILFDSLYKKCQTKKNISFILGTEITSLSSLKKDFDLVIVANGSHSLLRKELPIEQKYKNYPYGCVWTTIEDETTTLNKLQQYVYYSKHMFGLLPSGKKENKRLLSVFWSLPIRDKDSYSKEDMFKEMEKHHPDPIVINKIKEAPLAFATYADVWMKKFNHDNVVVIGDAAHGMSPQLGQGANMAFIDAYFLNKLLNPHDIVGSLEKYSKLRKKHLHFYTQASRFLTPLFQSDKLTCGLIRDYIFSYSQKLKYSQFMSSQILCGKRLSWWNKKELSYEID